MGTIKKGIVGGFSGKVGPVTGSSWKGKPYIKARPKTMTNPRSQGQLDHRGKFTASIKFLSPMKQFLKAGFAEMAVDKTAFNAAMAWNYRNAVTGSYPDFEIDYSKVLVSQGSLAGALNPEVSASEGRIHFSWQNNADNMQAMDTDKALLLVYCPALGQAEFVVDGNSRNSGSQSMKVSSNFKGQLVHCYLSFQNSEGTAASNSQLVGSIVAD